MKVKLIDREGKELLVEDFVKFPTPGEIVPLGFKEDFSVTSEPVRHELVREPLALGARFIRVPVVTVEPVKASKPSRKVPTKG